MARIDNHGEQVKHNMACHTYLAQGGSYHDWCTTVIFYIALHMVDQYLAKYGWHPRNHTERYSYIRNYLQNIRVEYNHLYHASRRSRYETDYLSATDKGRTYYEKVLNDSFIPLSQKLTNILSAPGP
jgi:hypothetical protein